MVLGKTRIPLSVSLFRLMDRAKHLMCEIAADSRMVLYHDPTLARPCITRSAFVCSLDPLEAHESISHGCSTAPTTTCSARSRRSFALLRQFFSERRGVTVAARCRTCSILYCGRCRRRRCTLHYWRCILHDCSGLLWLVFFATSLPLRERSR